MNYSKREIIYKGKVEEIVFDFPQEYEVLSTFLSVDIKSFSDYFIEEISKVINGEEKEREISGNICGAYITRTTTKVFDMISEDEKSCQISTKELLFIINEYLNQNNI
ncbi:MAG: hypothetical protein ACRC7N_05970 [Clostridium sp.]